MKKIIALLLIVSCVFALGSCKLINKIKDKGQGTDEPQTVVIDTEAVAAIQAKIDASVPDKANITVVLDSVLGEIKGEYKLVYNMDGSATVEYYYEKLNSFDEAALENEYKSTVTGTTTVAADGTVTDPIGGTASVEAVTFDINLDASKLASATVSGGVLIAKVKAADTLAVLGTEIGADVDLVISTGTLGITSVAISYNTQSGPVEIVATYTYCVDVEEEETEEGAEEETEEGTEEGTEA